VAVDQAQVGLESDHIVLNAHHSGSQSSAGSVNIAELIGHRNSIDKQVEHPLSHGWVCHHQFRKVIGSQLVLRPVGDLDADCPGSIHKCITGQVEVVQLCSCETSGALENLKHHVCRVFFVWWCSEFLMDVGLTTAPSKSRYRDRLTNAAGVGCSVGHGSNTAAV
jgi:hypothetical protein